MADTLTYADLREMPEDGWRYELLEGDIVGSPAPTVRHQLVVTALALFLGEAVRDGAGTLLLAPTDVVFDAELNALEPDLLFIARDRAGYLITETHIQGAPDLVVEVLSGRSAARDLGAKHTVYARHGVRHYWVADPDADVLRFPLRPAIAVRVADLFAGI